MKTAYRDYSITCDKTELAKNASILRKNGGHDLYTALLIMKAFEADFPDLQAELGDCYFSGDGVHQDKEKAYLLFEQALKNGSVRVNYDFGWYYYDRNDYLRAIEHFKICLNHSTQFNDYKLGHCYACIGDSYSKKAEPNMSMAIENLAVAAEKYKDGFSCMRLGMIYSNKSDNSFNPEKAIKYYSLGASYGSDRAIHELSKSYILGNKELNINPNWEKAERLLLPHANSNDADVLNDLGLLYMVGDTNNAGRDLQKSKQFYERAWAVQQHPLTASRLGYVCFCLENFMEAEKMLKYADEEDVCHYSDFLGRIYNCGYVVPRDPQKAAYYYGRKYNDSHSLNNLFTFDEYANLLEEIGEYSKSYEVAEAGEREYNDVCFVYIRGKLVLKRRVIDKASLSEAAEMMEACIRYDTNVKEAHSMLADYYLLFKEYRKAERHLLDLAEMGDANAALRLGRLYEAGGGSIISSVDKAYSWYEKSASMGSDEGQKELDCFKRGVFGGIRRTRGFDHE